MPQITGRLPSTSAFLSKLKTAKPLILRWAVPRFTTLLQAIWRLKRVRERKDDTAPNTILVISCHYGRWRYHSDGDSMQLNTVQGDMKALLDYHGFQHDGTDGQHWRFLTDHDFDYKDSSHTTKRLPRTGLPTRDNILRTIREVTQGGGSCLIYYSGHCYYKAPGTSELKYQSGDIIYQETEDSRLGPKAAYLVSCDGKRVYGKEFYDSLQNTSNDVGASTVTVVLDTCRAEAFIRDFDFGEISVIYDAGTVEIVRNAPTLSAPPLGQLVVVTATRADELAWTVDGCGVLTKFLFECLQMYPTALADKFVNYLDIECARQPVESKRQHPRIWSRSLLDGPFRLLPENAPALVEHSQVPSV